MTQSTFKRVLVKEELMLLTKERVEAVVLSQLLYWTKRVKDYGALMLEEDGRQGRDPNATPKHGWIFKSAEELSVEIILGFSPSTVRRALLRLVEKGYLYERSNPKHAWDRTRQYRINLASIVQGLADLGIEVNRSNLLSDEEHPSQIAQPTERPARCIRHAAACIKRREPSIRHHDRAVPEITPENTDKSESHPQTPSSCRVDNQSVSPKRRGQTLADPGLVSHAEPRLGQTLSDPDFLTFWSIYPRQIGQWSAFQAWESALKQQQPRAISASELISAARNYARYTAGREPRYIMHPATFLGHDRRYLEYLRAKPDTIKSRSNRCSQSSVCWEQDYRPYNQRTETELVRMLNEMPPHFLPQVEPSVREELNSRGYDAVLPPGKLSYEFVTLGTPVLL